MTDYEELEQSDLFLLRQEEFIVDIQEEICKKMSDLNVLAVDLSIALSKDMGFIKNCLSSGRRLTVRNIADIATALGCRARIAFELEKK